jgi:hypothetical protein
VPDGESISIAKYFPHKFEWKWMDKEEEIVENKKKGKQVKYKAANADLKKLPFFLKDGDIVGVRFESENESKLDDFQTDEDKVLQQEFNIRKEQERKEREAEKAKQGGGGGKNKRDEGPGIYIRLDEDYPVELLSQVDDEKTGQQPV